MAIQMERFSSIENGHGTDHDSLPMMMSPSEQVKGRKILVTLNVGLTVICTLLSVTVVLLAGKVEFNPTETPAVHTYDAQKGQGVCSGHGVHYGYTELGTGGWCECFNCWEGLTCDQPAAECYAMATGGDPLFFEEYWLQHAADLTAVHLHPAFKIGYSLNEPGPMSVITHLKQQIIALHNLVGNAETDGYHIVLGAGSTQLINAALYALGERGAGSGGEPTPVVAGAPFYGAYKVAADYWSSRYFEWRGNMTEVASLGPEREVIEFVTSPNNPDGGLNRPLLDRAHTVLDSAYYWPHFVPIQERRAPQGRGMLLFTLSKLTGHAGTRIGWALVKDAEVAAKMDAFVSSAGLGLAREPSMRALTLLTHLVDSQGALLQWAARGMTHKWDTLKALFEGSTRFSVQTFLGEPLRCAFMQKPMAPAPAYLWVKCEHAADDLPCDAAPGAHAYRGMPACGCAKAFMNAGIVGVPGTFYGASSEFVRIELLQRMEDFDVLASKLEKLLKE